MNLHKLILTENACYKAGRKITVKGIMVHSTGANNPNLKRYVGPDDGLLGKNQYGNHWNTYHPGGREVCVHAFIGKLADGTIATYQTLPWNHRGWHAGAVQTIPISVLKSARTVLRIMPTLRRCTVRPLNFVPTSVRSTV